MSVEATVWAWKQALKPTTKIVLLRLADHANGDGCCWPGRKSLAAWTGLSESQVKRSIRQLEELGLLEVKIRKSKDGGNWSNYYLLTMGGHTEPPGGSQ